jgi:hypothetical protein
MAVGTVVVLVSGLFQSDMAVDAVVLLVVTSVSVSAVRVLSADCWLATAASSLPTRPSQNTIQRGTTAAPELSAGLSS